VKECEGESPGGSMTKWKFNNVDIREDDDEEVILILARIVGDATRGKWMDCNATRQCGATRQSGVRQ
jgi:hypothetical protein